MGRGQRTVRVNLELKVVDNLLVEEKEFREVEFHIDSVMKRGGVVVVAGGDIAGF